jgi:hypothetical protein
VFTLLVYLATSSLQSRKEHHTDARLVPILHVLVSAAQKDHRGASTWCLSCPCGSAHRAEYKYKATDLLLEVAFSGDPPWSRPGKGAQNAEVVDVLSSTDYMLLVISQRNSNVNDWNITHDVVMQESVIHECVFAFASLVFVLGMRSSISNPVKLAPPFSEQLVCVTQPSFT